MIDAELLRSLPSTFGAGLALTVALTVLTGVASFAVAVPVAGLRLASSRRLRWPVVAYIEVFRNVPALIQIIFWAFALPTLFPMQIRQRLFFDNAVVDALGAVTGIPLPYYGLAAALGLTLNTSAHLAEILRGGMQSVPRQHVDAARSLGAGRRAAFLSVLVPAGIRAAFPAVSTRLIHNMKNTALASFVAVPELFSRVQGEITRTFDATRLLLVAAVMYLLLAWLMTVLLAAVDARLRGPGSEPARG
ncbi:MAG: amino acid ABC transporter permease [Actinomycetota bacterium]